MQAKTQPRPRLSAQERRQSILEAAIKLFAEKGFRGTTTRELAGAVGVSEPVLYEHFPSKRELFVALLDYSTAGALDRLRRASQVSLESRDDRLFLMQLATLIMDIHLRTPEIIRVMDNAMLEDPELAAHECKIRNAFVGIIKDYLEIRMDSGALRRVDPGVVALAVGGMFMKVAHLAMTAPNEVDPESVIDQMVDLILYGLKPGKEETHA